MLAPTALTTKHQSIPGPNVASLDPVVETGALPLVGVPLAGVDPPAPIPDP